MHIDWTPLRVALAASRRDGLDLPFWWRDDDAIAPTSALDQLAALGDDASLPVHLAVIPAHATDALADRVDGTQLIPLVHGWAHKDHSAPDQKKNEFLTDRVDLAHDSAQALKRMHDLFGPRLRHMFVPPWNRVQDGLLPTLATQGYTALSTFGPRRQAEAAPGLAQVNTHIDPIWWKGTRDLVSPDHLVTQTAAHIDARRRGDEDGTEPLGLLTHHLVHTPAIWAFTHGFIHEMLSGGATPWTMETTR
ncbi:polysaccharide deacetylase family protein [uncultured Tateyamaria sp.]|uniref:polysaccharide deacetylase family protein n=1 Tax=uncultured Tateyamaria sp. TaxID=455651 RepID=UPI002609A198|nr:polysaccharide deacetylase family protein [uncultured Tateyamaria sp.]